MSIRDKFFCGRELSPKDWANTELGGIDGPGGRWIIYGDGNVVWKPN